MMNRCGTRPASHLAIVKVIGNRSTAVVSSERRETRRARRYERP